MIFSFLFNSCNIEKSLGWVSLVDILSRFMIAMFLKDRYKIRRESWELDHYIYIDEYPKNTQTIKRIDDFGLWWIWEDSPSDILAEDWEYIPKKCNTRILKTIHNKSMNKKWRKQDE